MPWRTSTPWFLKLSSAAVLMAAPRFFQTCPNVDQRLRTSMLLTPVAMLCAFMPSLVLSVRNRDNTTTLVTGFLVYQGLGILCCVYMRVSTYYSVLDQRPLAVALLMVHCLYKTLTDINTYRHIVLLRNLCRTVLVALFVVNLWVVASVVTYTLPIDIVTVGIIFLPECVGLATDVVCKVLRNTGNEYEGLLAGQL